MTCNLTSLEALYQAGDLGVSAFNEAHTLGEKYLTVLRADLPPDEFTAAQERGKLLDLENLAAEILASPLLFPMSGT